MNSDLYFEGKKYISARRAAEASGYSTDYIGQLCRVKKLECKMIGRGWFVSESSLADHQNSFSENQNKTSSSPNIISEIVSNIQKAKEFEAGKKDEISSSRDIRDSLNPPSQLVYSSDEKPLIPELKKLENEQAEKIASICHSRECENPVSVNTDTDPRFPSFVRNFGRARYEGDKISPIQNDFENITFKNRRFRRTLQTGTSLFVLSAIVLAIFFAKDASQVKSIYKESAVLTKEIGWNAVAGLSEAKNYLAEIGAKNAANIFAKLSNFKLLGEVEESSLKNAPSDALNNISLKIYDGVNEILSGTKNYFAGFFGGKNKFAENEIVPIKKFSSSLSSSSYSARVGSSSGGKVGSSSSVSVVRVALTTPSLDSSQSSTYNLTPNTYNLKPDITRREVLDLIKQFDDDSKSLIYATNAITGANSLITNQSLSDLKNKINSLEQKESLVPRQFDHVYNSISRSFSDITALDGVTMTNSSFSGTTGTFTGLLTGADGAFSGDITVSSELTVSGAGTSTISGRLLATKAPTLAHTFSVWDTDTANSNVLDSSILINPSSAVADSNLFGIAVNDNVKFLVDAEGDVFVRNLTATGTVNQANTSISTLTVENTAVFGDAVGDSITFNAGTITSANPISWNLPNSQISALNFESGLFNLDTSNSRVGIGTTSPGTILSVSGVGNFAGTGSTFYSTLTAPYFTATSTTASTFPYASTTALTVSGNSYLGTVSSGTWNGALIGVPYGGTGWSAIQSGSIPYGNGTSALSTTTAGTSGNILALLNGVPTWTATTTLSDITGTLSVSKGGTGQSSFGQGWINSDGTTLSASTSPTVNYIYATSTTATSTFAWGVQANALNITSTTATSTFANGIALSKGCFLMPNGTCAGTGSGTVTSVATNNGLTGGTITTAGTIGLNTAGFLTNGLLTWDGSNLVATGTPNLTAGYFTATSTTSTSTFAGGLSITGTGTGLNFGSDTLFYQNNQRFLTSTAGSNGNLTIGYQSATGLDANGGLYNTGVGYQALGNATSTGYNTALGYQALKGSTTIPNISGNNTAVGYKALTANTTGLNNVAGGRDSLISNTAGINNTAFGTYSLYSNTTGTSNIGIGYQTGYGSGGDMQSVSDDYAIFIGYRASRDASVSNIVPLANIVAIGKNAKVAISNSIVLGGTGSDAVNVGIGTSTPWAKLSIQNTYGSQTPLFDIASSTSAAYATSSVFRINADGNIGIGTTSPNWKLSVVGNISADDYVRASYLIATSTATSTFANLAVATQLKLGSDYLTDLTGTNLSITDGVLSASSGASPDWKKETNYGALALTASTTIPYWAKDAIYASSTSVFQGLATFGNASTSQISATNSYLGTVLSGVWNGSVIGDTYLTKSGDWTGTLDGQEGSYYLARANHTGTQSMATLANYDWIFSSNYGTNNLAGSTTMPLWARGGINASSTSNFVYASTTALTVSGNSYLGTVSSGVWNGSALSDAYVDDDITLTNITQITNRAITDTSGTLTVARGGTGQTSFGQGWLHSDGSTFTSSTSPTVAYLTATSTATSTFAGGMNVAGTAGLTVLQNGKVGIGTTEPTTKLEVLGSLYPVVRVVRSVSAGISQYTPFSIKAKTSADMVDTFGVDFDFLIEDNAGIENPIALIRAKRSGADNSGLLTFVTYNAGAQAEKMVIMPNGNIGIGTTTPYSKLSVWGASTGANRLFELTDSASTTLATFQENGTGYFLGNIGIGTSSPYAKLSVVGQTVAEYFTATSTTATSTFAWGVQANALNITSTTATSTFANGIALSKGCFLMPNGTCAGTGSGTVTSVATNNGLTGGTITDSGTIGLNTAGFLTNGLLTWDGSNLVATGTPNLTAGYFTATSTTSTSTFAGGLSITGTGTGLNFGSDTLFYQNNERFLTSSTTDAGNLTVGYQSATGLDANGGLYNTGVGYQALRNATSTNYNTALGYQALLGSATISNTGYNTAVGYQALYSNTTGFYNTANGYRSLYSNTTGNYNTSLGADSLFLNTTGYENTALGVNSLGLNTTGYHNTALGMTSLYNNSTGIKNVALGYDSLYYPNATNTTAIGYQAGMGVFDNSFQNATLLGYKAGFGLSTGSNNLLLGYQAGDALTSGSNNIVLGYDIDAPSPTSANTLNIGNLIFGTGIDGNGTKLSSGKIGIGTTTPLNKLTIHNATTTSTVDADLGFTATSTGLASYYNWTIGIDISDAGKFKIASSTTLGTNDRFVIDGNGYLGLGTAIPGRKLDVFEVTSNSQVRISQSDSVYSELFVDSVGDLRMSATGGDIRALNENLYICAGDACETGAPSATGNILVENSIGIGSTTPFSKLSIGSGGAITVGENNIATSSTIALSWTDGNQQLVRIGTSAITINFSNYIDGQNLKVVVCNPTAGTAGTITWGTEVLWPGGVEPGQTTTANKCDVWSFLATVATSTLKIFGNVASSF